jgi:hypothetical protein
MGAHLLHDLPCKNCGTPFKARLYDYNRGFKIFCGKECYNATRPKGFGKATATQYERKIASQKRNPVQTAARRELEDALKRGEIIRHPCFVCSEKKVEGHHWDYGRPLSVFWLCRPHHVAAHDGAILLPLPKKNPKVPAEEWPRGRLCRPRTKPDHS